MKPIDRGYAFLWNGIKTGLKYAQDAAVWCLMLSVLLHLLGCDRNRILVVGLAFAAGFLASLGQDLWGRRRMGMIPILAFLLFLYGIPDAMLLLPLGAYLILCIERGQLVPDYSGMYEHYLQMLAVVLAAGILTYLEGMNWGLPLALFTVSSMVFLLRMLRQEIDEQADLRSILWNLLLVTGIFLVGLLVSRPEMLRLGAAVLKILYQLFVVPIFYLVAIVIGGGLYLVLMFLKGLVLPETASAAEESVMEQIAETAGLESVAGDPSAWLMMGLRILGALIFLLAAVLFFRSLYQTMKSRGEVRAAEGSVRRLRAGEDHYAEEGRGPGILARTPEARVRRAYGGFYRRMRTVYAGIHPGDTSLDVENLAVPAVKMDEAEELRQLYLRARYTERGQLGIEDARRAEQLAKSLKKTIES